MTETLSPVFAALGDETRWTILARLAERPSSASRLAPELPISRQAIVMASRSSPVPSCRACAAGTAELKKTHTCAPLPDRDRSRAAGTPLRWQASR